MHLLKIYVKILYIKSLYNTYIFVTAVHLSISSVQFNYAFICLLQI